MRLWLLRSLVFVLLTLGGSAFSLIIYDRIILQRDMKQVHSVHRSEYLENVGRLLLEWHAGGKGEAIGAFVTKQHEEGNFYALVGPGGHVLAGAYPDAELRAFARQAHNRNGYKVQREESAGGPPGPWHPGMETMTFQDDGGRYYTLALHHESSRQSELKPLHPLFFVIPGTVVAVLVLYAFFRFSSATSRELRTALRRLAQGDFGVRVDKALEQRRDPFAKLAKDFNDTVVVLAEKQAEQRYLISELTHEMRSPLTRMALAMELARNTDHERTMHLLQRIKADSDKLNDLSEQMLEYARSQWRHPGKKPLNMGNLLHALAKECDAEAASHGKRVRFVGNGACRVLGIDSQLDNMFRNVVRNAIRHTRRNSTVQLFMEPLPQERMARFVIRDHGPGMPPDVLDKVFEPLRQGNGVHGDAGLGLTIAKHINERHGGSMTLANHQEGGLEVTILLPLLPPASVEKTLGAKSAVEGRVVLEKGPSCATS